MGDEYDHWTSWIPSKTTRATRWARACSGPRRKTSLARTTWTSLSRLGAMGMATTQRIEKTSWKNYRGKLAPKTSTIWLIMILVICYSNNTVSLKPTNSLCWIPVQHWQLERSLYCGWKTYGISVFQFCLMHYLLQAVTSESELQDFVVNQLQHQLPIAQIQIEHDRAIFVLTSRYSI